jgi:hypothetical protein
MFFCGTVAIPEFLPSVPVLFFTRTDYLQSSLLLRHLNPHFHSYRSCFLSLLLWLLPVPVKRFFRSSPDCTAISIISVMADTYDVIALLRWAGIGSQAHMCICPE